MYTLLNAIIKQPEEDCINYANYAVPVDVFPSLVAKIFRCNFTAYTQWCSYLAGCPLRYDRQPPQGKTEHSII